MRQNICTVRTIISAPTGRQATYDIPLMRQVVNDQEYGVGSRPSLPACFEDANELGVVDKDCDMRHSKWDDLADICRQSPAKRVDSDPEPTPDSEPTPTE